MNNSSIHFQLCTPAEREEIIEFLFSIGDELHLSKRSDAETVINRIFAQGGVIAGYHNGVLIAMLGYFIGEPNQNYANKDVGFIYVTGLVKEYRLSRACWQGLDFTIRHLHALGLKEIRCHARAEDPYTNRIYSHFAKRLGNDVSLRGDPTILYGNTIEGVLAYLDKGKTRRTTRPAPVMQPSNTMPVSHHQLSTTQPDGVLWHCSPCDVWWLSKAAAYPDSWHLERLTASDNLVQHKAKAPAWNVSGPSPLFCPECGQTMAAPNMPTTNHEPFHRFQQNGRILRR